MLSSQLRGESAPSVHLPAAGEASGCRQNYSDLGAQREPHGGPEHVLTPVEGGEPLTDCNATLCRCKRPADYLCWPAGVARVLWIRTRRQIHPLPAPAEEQFPERLLPDALHGQLRGYQSGSLQLLAASPVKLHQDSGSWNMMTNNLQNNQNN